MVLEIGQLFYLFILGLILALLEIEIEGTEGWAKNLPTKKIKFWWYAKFGKEVTGYHLALQVFLLLFFHLPLVLFHNFSLELELLVLTQYFFFLVYWDFLWFVLNPGFRLRNFKRGGVPWYAKWFLGLPAEYWLALVVGVFLPAVFFGLPAVIIQLEYFLTYLSLTILTIILFFIFARHRL